MATEIQQKLYAFRHAKSRANNAPHLLGGRNNGVELAPEGRYEARNLGRVVLKKELWPDVIYSSPAVRTLSTAQLSLRAMGCALPIQIDDRLQEMSQGIHEGKLRTLVYTDEEYARMDDEERDYKLPAGESMNEVGERMFEWLIDEIDPQPDGTTTFAFTHGVAIKCLAGYLHNWPRQQIYETHVPNTSASLFVKQHGQWRLEYVGQDVRKA